MSKLIPLAGYVLIEPLNEEEQTSEGLYLPEKAKDKPEKGKVIAKGAYMYLESAGYNLVLYDKVQVGQKVVFHKWAGQDVKEGTKEYKLVKFSDLMGVYE